MNAMIPAPGFDYTEMYDPDADFDAWYTRATALRVRAWLRPGQRVLELGCATGLMTSLIASVPVTVLAVDRSDGYLARARARGLAGATFARADLDTFAPAAVPFDHVLATNVLHEVADPEALLRRAARWLAAGGLVHVSLQNPLSIHRLQAAARGAIDDVCALSDRGRAYGTRRLWLAADLVELARQAGLEPVAQAGVMVKPYPNAVMATLPEPVLEGLVRAADSLPDHCAMNYLVLRKAEDR